MVWSVKGWYLPYSFTCALNQRPPLILNISTSNVSPQFHCIYDDEFTMCKIDTKFTSIWQIKAKVKDDPPYILDLIDQGVPLPSFHPKTLLFIDWWRSSTGLSKNSFSMKFKRAVNLTIPRMIDHTISIVGLDKQDSRVKMYDTLVVDILNSSRLKNLASKTWSYRLVIWFLSYTQVIVCLDIKFDVHQCASFCNKLTKDQVEAVKRFWWYLLRTTDKALVLRPDKFKGLEYYVDAD